MWHHHRSPVTSRSQKRHWDPPYPAQESTLPVPYFWPPRLWGDSLWHLSHSVCSALFWWPQLSDHCSNCDSLGLRPQDHWPHSHASAALPPVCPLVCLSFSSFQSSPFLTLLSAMPLSLLQSLCLWFLYLCLPSLSLPFCPPLLSICLNLPLLSSPFASISLYLCLCVSPHLFLSPCLCLPFLYSFCNPACIFLFSFFIIFVSLSLSMFFCFLLIIIFILLFLLLLPSLSPWATGRGWWYPVVLGQSLMILGQILDSLPIVTLAKDLWEVYSRAFFYLIFQTSQAKNKWTNKRNLWYCQVSEVSV